MSASNFLSTVQTTSQLLDQLFAQTKLGMVLTDPRATDNPIIACNNAFCVLTGYDRDEIIGRNCRFLQGVDTDEEEIERLRDCLSRRDTCQFEILNFKKDGTPFWNALHISPIYGDDGQIAYYFGSQWDITERVETRKQAERTAERLDYSLAAARALGTFDWNVGSNVVSVDPPFAQVYGLDPMEAAKGLPSEMFFDRIDAADRERVRAAAAKAVEEGGTFEEEYGIEAPNGHHWLLSHGRCWLDDDGAPMRFSGVVLDITDRKEAELGRQAALERADLMLREVNHRVKNLFALVPAIVRMSLRATDDAAELAAQIEARVGALARSHSLTLSAASAQDGVDIAGVVPAVLEPYVDDHDPFVMSGAPQRLREMEANTISLALHELATNAAKHGALSTEAGRVHIGWTLEEGVEPILKVIWKETAGPILSGPPAVTGFGTDLIDKLVRVMGGSVERQWRGEGLEVTLEVPIEAEPGSHA